MSHLGTILLTASILLSATIGCSTPPHPKPVTVYHADLAREASYAQSLYEKGYLDLAEQKFRAVLQIDPNNAKAQYYLNLVQQTHVQRTADEHKPRGYYQTIPQQPIY
ncbi:MAG TPA: hypothetical protein VN873_16910 [Candidatus Angelobacter sp.]|nr:hypothetical protein [Candidatus Angelobacter sp.]